MTLAILELEILVVRSRPDTFVHNVQLLGVFVIERVVAREVLYCGFRDHSSTFRHYPIAHIRTYSVRYANPSTDVAFIRGVFSVIPNWIPNVKIDVF